MYLVLVVANFLHTLCVYLLGLGFNLIDPTSTLLLKFDEPHQEAKAQQKWCLSD